MIKKAATALIILSAFLGTSLYAAPYASCPEGEFPFCSDWTCICSPLN
ncbi:hypothetical protein HQQ94_02965 [Shewanella sp. VB17]|nr:hypothetical protein [Shewanella sp. VB17]NRD72214.1 hypothetical protein [Shewanella sp. VB17]